MGWQLLEEVACARPPKPGPEWWTLVDIALDARDKTRQSMCGEAYLTERGKCSRATLYRRLEKLHADGLIRTVRRSAPGRRGAEGIRAIYEIAQLHGTSLTTGETRSIVDKQVAEELTSLTTGETRPDIDGSHNPFEQVSESVRTSLTTGETHAVTHAVTNSEPSHIEVLELDGPEESKAGPPDQPHADVIAMPPRPYRPRHSAEEIAASQVAESRKLRAGRTP